MSERTKFIIKVIGFGLATILIGIALYMVFFKKTIAPTATEPSLTTQTGTLPGTGAGKPGSTTPGSTTPGGTGTSLPPSKVANGGKTFTTLLTNTKILSPTATTNGTVAYYDPANGKFYTVNASGKVVALSDATFPKADSVTFDAGATAAVIEFPDGSNVVYDFEAAKQITLPPHWEDFSFSGDGTSIAAKSIGNDASNRAIVVTNADGSQTKVLASLGDNANKVDMSWSPNNSVLGFSATGINPGGTFSRQEIYLIGPDGGASGTLFVDGQNFHNIWSPDGTHLLYSVGDPNDGYKAALWYADSRGDRSGNTRRKMGISTSVNKCTFISADKAYCAVPREMAPGGGSDESLITAYDDVYTLDIATGSATLLATPAADTKMFTLSVSSDGASLYYEDAAGRLNVIRLK